MFRYIVIAWDVKSASDSDAESRLRRCIQSSSVSRWRPALDRPGIYAACIDQESGVDTTIPVSDRRGVILGTIFRSPGSCHSNQPTLIRSLSGSESEEILRSMGRSLVSDCWGYYVAALHYPESGSAVVLRGPVSPLACFHVELGTLNVFFSHPDDCIDLKITPLSINWDSITAQVMGGDHLTNETAIEEIDSLESGECVECKPDGCSRHVYWDPRSFLEERSPTTFDQATQSIRLATEYCVRALSSRHDRILVKLSGGLDSSIVLSSLSRAPHLPSITAVNYCSRGSGDASRFARTGVHGLRPQASMAASIRCERRQIGGARRGGGRATPLQHGGSLPPSVAQTVSTHRPGLVRTTVRPHHRIVQQMPLPVLGVAWSNTGISTGQPAAARDSSANTDIFALQIFAGSSRGARGLRGCAAAGDCAAGFGQGRPGSVGEGSSREQYPVSAGISPGRHSGAAAIDRSNEAGDRVVAPRGQVHRGRGRHLREALYRSMASSVAASRRRARRLARESGLRIDPVSIEASP